MRILAISVAAASLALSTPVLLSTPAFAAAGNPTMKQCAAEWQAKKSAGAARGNYRDFSKMCLAGKTTAGRTPGQTRMEQIGPQAAPTAAAPKGSNADAANATARCKDGAYSHAQGHTGACSHHGGVGQWLK
jgi:hypothetical protein